MCVCFEGKKKKVNKQKHEKMNLKAGEEQTKISF
jgi:hypothetical protein